MKRGTPRHWKAAQLAKELGVPIYGAVGILEIIWHVASEFTPRGDLGRMPDDAIACAVGWEKDPEILVAALVKCRWLDAHDVHRLVVHDWSQHAEDSVHMRLARDGMLFADNTAPRTSRLGKEERKECERKLSHALAVRTESALPSHPIPSHPKPDHSFADEIYAAYPRKAARADGLKAIRAALKKETGAHLIDRTKAYAAAVAKWPQSDMQFVPYPASWFRSEQYNDDPVQWARKAGGNGNGSKPHPELPRRSIAEVT